MGGVVLEEGAFDYFWVMVHYPHYQIADLGCAKLSKNRIATEPIESVHRVTFQEYGRYHQYNRVDSSLPKVLSIIVV